MHTGGFLSLVMLGIEPLGFVSFLIDQLTQFVIAVYKLTMFMGLIYCVSLVFAVFALRVKG